MGKRRNYAPAFCSRVARRIEHSQYHRGKLFHRHAASTASKLTFDDNNVTVQAGNVIVGGMAGATGGSSATKGGSISFNAGVSASPI